MIIGMDIIAMLGGVYVGSNNDVQFGGQHCAAGAVTENDSEQLKIDESDFTAVFDSVKWTMEWKWENGEPTMANQGSEYAVPKDCREIFDDECAKKSYGHGVKEPVPLTNSRVLGLRVIKDPDSQYKWYRDGEVPILQEIPTKRELFSVFGKLIGQYPVAGWLRPACSYLKRQTNEIGWDEEIPVPVRAFAKEVMNRMLQHDPVTGCWSVSNVLEGVVWCDASSLAVGCCLEIDGSIVEDSTWLRKFDESHINVAELEAVIKGLNIALRWGIAKLKIVTDSASVYGWVQSILVDSKKPKVSGLSEMVIKRKLGIISQLVIEYHIKMTIQLVLSTSNKADVLTRVPQKWLNSPCLAVVTLDDKTEEITKLHGKYHLGVKKTLYLAKRMCGQYVDEKVVKQVVDSCNQCRRVDPVSIKWNHGRLSVDKVWQRVALDIAYVNKRAFLTLIDCGLSRFAMWRRLPNETASTVAKELHRIFLER
ncbi:uncharacterized protein [Watersipora subatra]|uniref:uncharacterized protein n=1 Tax=Watersipora subatra TaxID=2589382 RepID=UPI00355B647C